MGESKYQRFQNSGSQNCSSDNKNEDQWMMTNQGRARNSSSCVTSPSTSNSMNEDSTITNGSFSSADTTDDASSSTTSTYSSSLNLNSCEALYDLSELMAQLPIKRGLSKYYQGKSESFTCLSRVTSLDDLPKKERKAHRRKIKAKNGGLDAYKSFTPPKPIITKKTPRTSVSSSSFPSRRLSFISRTSGRPQ